MSPLKRSFLLAAGALLVSGCSKYYYNPAQQILPQHLRKIAVRPFTNRTDRQNLPERLRIELELEFNRDGRWQIVNESEADGVVIGEITRYIRMPLKHDANNVATEYKLWMLVDISLYDMTSRQTLWKEPNLEAILIAPPSSSGLPGAITEAEAQDKLCQQLAKDIATRTFEGFGSVTGASEKSVPKSSIGQSTSPAAAPQ